MNCSRGRRPRPPTPAADPGRRPRPPTPAADPAGLAVAGFWSFVQVHEGCGRAISGLSGAMSSAAEGCRLGSITAASCFCPRGHHKTTTDFFNAMNANHHRHAIRSLSASRPSFSCPS